MVSGYRLDFPTLYVLCDNRVGPVDIGYARLIWKRAVESGYDLAPFTSFGKPVLTRSREEREGNRSG